MCNKYALDRSSNINPKQSVFQHANEYAMSRLFRLPTAVKRDPNIDDWLQMQDHELGPIAQYWFDVMRGCGDDVWEIMHDGHPTACIVDTAFAYVNAFKAHVNVGFFFGAEIHDPSGLLEGTGKFMRHVKLRPNHHMNSNTLRSLIETAYVDLKRRLDT